MSARLDVCWSPLVVLLARARPPRAAEPQRERIVAAGRARPPRRAACVAAASALATARGRRLRRRLRARPSAHRRSCSALALGVALALARRSADRHRASASSSPRSSTRTIRRARDPERAGGGRADRRARAAAVHAQAALLTLGGAGAGGHARARAASRPPLSLGPLLRHRPAVRDARGGAAAGSSTSSGRPLSRRRHRGGRLLHRLPRGRRPRADRRAARRRPARRRRALRLPPERARLGAGGDPRVLEDLHARGLRDLALPQAALPAGRAAAGARLPVPLLDVRPGDGRRRSSSARPAAPLPQLPLLIDAERRPARGRATSRGPVGPSWWGVRSRAGARP